MMNNQIEPYNTEAGEVQRAREYSINRPREVVDYSINEIEHHVDYKRKFRDIRNIMSIDNNAFLLAYLEPLKKNQNFPIYNNFKTYFTNSQNVRRCFYESNKLYQKILCDIKSINEKISTHFGNLVRSVDDLDDFRIRRNLNYIDITSQLESFKSNLDQFENQINEIENFVIDENIEMRSYIGTLSNNSTFISFNEEIKNEEENLNKICSELLEISYEHSKIAAEFENKTQIVGLYSKLLKLKENNLNSIRERIELLNNAKLKSAAEKIEILKLSNEKSKLIEKNERVEVLRKNQDESYVNKVNEIKDAQSNLIHEIKATKNFTKIHHIIFVLDESGSMSGVFEKVRENVKSLIKDRNKVPLTKEKVSVIKFSHTASIQVLNADVREEIEIGEMIGGGTSFVAALSKLEEVMGEINGEKYVPTVFFLSDGYGESKNLVLNKSHEVLNKFQTLDILFFSVGFGKSADKETLEEMAKVFNRGNSLLKIGDEMCKLYFNAENCQDLNRAFSSYQKLFSYQKNEISIKQEIFIEQLNNLTLSYEQAKKEFDKMLEHNQQSFSLRSRETKKNAVNLENLDKVYDQELEKLNQILVKTTKEAEEIMRVKQTHVNDLNNFETKLKLVEDKQSTKINEYDEKKENLLSWKNKELKNRKESIQQADDNREENFNQVVNRLANLEVNTNDDFRTYYQKFLIDYKNHEQNISELAESGNRIASNFKSTKDSLEDIKKGFEGLDGLFNSNSRCSRSVLEKIIKILKQENNIDQSVNLEEAIQSILINSLGERNRRKIDEALEILSSYLSFEKIIETFLTNSNKMLKYFDKKMDELIEIEEQLRDRKAEATERPIINDLEQQIEENRNQQRLLRKHRVIIDRILDKLDYLTGTAKEKYIREVHIQILRSDYEQIQRFLTNFYVPLFQRLNSIEAGNK